VSHIRLYYYTGKQWGLKALWEKRLKVAQYSSVNDPFELIPFDRRTKRSRTFWERRVYPLLDKPYGMLCFSEAWQTNIMWSHYAEKHTGMCLGFDVTEQLAARVEYVSAQLPDPVQWRAGLRGMTDAVLEAALRHKHDAWAYERNGGFVCTCQSPPMGSFTKASTTMCICARSSLVRGAR
jgi:hypothetical protein